MSTIMAVESHARASWQHVVLRDGQPITSDLLEAAFYGDIPGIVAPLLSSKLCEEVARRITPAVAESYVNIPELSISIAGDPPLHWDLRYHNRGTWFENFAARKQVEDQGRELFGISPVELIINALGDWRHGNVHVLRHPVYGMPLTAVVIRRGAPKLHVDWVRWDLPGVRAIAQVGVNVYIANPEGGDLRVFNRIATSPGYTAESGRTPVGNYDLDSALVVDVEHDILPCRQGWIVIAPNRHLHEVTRVSQPARRITLSVHAAWLTDGSVGLFS